ncbi:glycosyltransferase [Chengkuizengella axinellae]|uniref:Glycosyltransferase n=1 Tax=Chengkuizengella axinellae TaxID=3064388 RepID=A0ABT9J356_9BACL|nr:glycosyltransferase [Chengkuizengella sp. 2205SS18-9]MDP5276003.1 glycosyltransferase [Chengkuizengella sp. 2205SS18-9]
MIKLNKLLVIIICCSIVYAPINALAERSENVKEDCYTQAVVDFKFELRRLWIDHTWWTRNVIISLLAGLDDKEKALERLLQNQVDIGNAIKPYYGEQAGDELSKLLTEHILIAGKIIDAAKREDKTEFEKYNIEWYKNADDIASFLSNANPNWSEEELQDLLYTHLKLTADEVIARLKQDWEADIAAFDEGEDHIIKLADALSVGIIEQFPDKFK